MEVVALVLIVKVPELTPLSARPVADAIELIVVVGNRYGDCVDGRTMRRRRSIGGVINRGARGRIRQLDRLRGRVSTWRRREVRRCRARGNNVGPARNRACQITGFHGDRVYRGG